MPPNAATGLKITNISRIEFLVKVKEPNRIKPIDAEIMAAATLPSYVVLLILSI